MDNYLPLRIDLVVCFLPLAKDANSIIGLASSTGTRSITLYKPKKEEWSARDFKNLPLCPTKQVYPHLRLLQPTPVAGFTHALSNVGIRNRRIERRRRSLAGHRGNLREWTERYIFNVWLRALMVPPLAEFLSGGKTVCSPLAVGHPRNSSFSSALHLGNGGLTG